MVLRWHSEATPVLGVEYYLVADLNVLVTNRLQMGEGQTEWI